MAKRLSLREFQEDLSRRLVSARRGEVSDALLGALSGGERWLVELPDSGEVLPLPELSIVPRTRPWFAGVASIRGVLYSVVDFSAFRGGAPTPRDARARLLLVGARHGTNSALLVDQTLGLKRLAEMTPEGAAAGPAHWAGDRYTDDQDQRWTRLRVKALLEDPHFLDVGL